jgi:hypothetical protein
MTTTLRAVLDAFDSGQAYSLGQLAQQLAVPPALLESMIAYWVRKGELREVNGETQCSACGHVTSCPFIMKMPRLYERVTGENAEPACTKYQV